MSLATLFNVRRVDAYSRSYCRVRFPDAFLEVVDNEIDVWASRLIADEELACEQSLLIDLPTLLLGIFYIGNSDLRKKCLAAWRKCYSSMILERIHIPQTNLLIAQQLSVFKDKTDNDLLSARVADLKISDSLAGLGAVDYLALSMHPAGKNKLLLRKPFYDFLLNIPRVRVNLGKKLRGVGNFGIG